MKWPDAGERADVGHWAHWVLWRAWPRWAHPPVVCVALIDGLDPLRMASSRADAAWGASEWAHHCTTLVREVIERRSRSRGRDITRCERQAIDAYEAGIAVSVYGLGSALVFPQPLMAFIGSEWTDKQLQRLRRIGVRHGLAIRQAINGAATQAPAWEAGE